MCVDINCHRATQCNIEAVKQNGENGTYPMFVDINSHRATQYNIEAVKQNGEMYLLDVCGCT